MSKSGRKKGVRRVEITSPGETTPDPEANGVQEGAECPFIPQKREDAPVAEEVAEQVAAQEEGESAQEQPADLEGALAELEEKCAYAQDQHLRVAAELQNYKRRVQQEKEQLVRFATEGLVTELIPVLDNFERAMEVDVDSPGAECLTAGVKMIHDQLHRALEAHGLERIEALGETFDPNLHEAVEREETTALPPDVVVAELAKGYRMHDRVIRPSRVRVTVKPKGGEGKAETSE
jgi:molecular chaperone GrpE